MIAAKAKKTNFWLSKLESYSYLHEVEVRYGAVDRISKKCDWYCKSVGTLWTIFEFFELYLEVLIAVIPPYCMFHRLNNGPVKVAIANIQIMLNFVNSEP